MEWGKFLLSMSLGHSSTRTEEHLGRHFSLGAFLFGGEKHFPSTACVRAPCQHWENRLLALGSSPFWNIPLLLSNHRNTRTRHRSPFLWVFRQGEITGASSNTGPSRGMTNLQGDCRPSPHSLLSSVGCWRHRFAVTSHLNLYNCARKLQGMKARQCLQSHWHSQPVFPRLTPFSVHLPFEKVCNQPLGNPAGTLEVSSDAWKPIEVREMQSWLQVRGWLC